MTVIKHLLNYVNDKSIKIVKKDNKFLYIVAIIFFCATVTIPIYRLCGVNYMFIGNNCNGCNTYNRMEMKNINQNLLPWLEDIIDEHNCKIERKEWKSKYNSYVVYDYEPFCTEGFEINLVISARESSFLNFVKYLYDEKLSTIEYLNNCADI